MKTKRWTQPQTKMFWRHFSKSCTDQGIPHNEREAYRKRVMKEECGADHLAELNRTSDYDKVMFRIAIDAQDYDGAARFESGRERRMAHLVEVCAAQLMQLQGVSESDALAYVISIIQQAKFSCRTDGSIWWLDLIEGQISALFNMLDTHRRRMLKSDGCTEGLKFDATLQYAKTSDGRYILIQQPISDADLLIRVA